MLTTPKYIVGLGELLFDVIDNRPILGGAPVNFAIQSHQALKLHGFLGTTAVRIGNDELATQAIKVLQNFGLSTEFVQRDQTHPTGTAIIHRQDDSHRFEIVEGVAWDAFEWNDQLATLCANTAVVCFGTLGQRSPKSRKTVRQFIETATHALRVFDVNLRQHYYDTDTITHGCHHADVLKLNQEEVAVVATALGIPPHQEDLKTCQTILAQANLQYVVYTQGEQGTSVISTDGVTTDTPVHFPAAANADSVGAGDACTAGIIAGTLLELPLKKTVTLANTLGAFVASQPGATPVLPPHLLPC